MVLGDAFREGQKLRQQWIQNPTPEVKEEMSKRGDIHIQNVYRFFGKWVTKKDPLRQAVKGVIFGTLYGMSVKTLGEDTKTAELGEIRAKINAAYKKYLATKDEKDNHVIEELRAQLSKLQNEDRTDYAQHILDKMFSTFKAGARWSKRMAKNAEQYGYVYSPFGRIRHLMAAVLVNKKNKRLISRQIRRGSNAPIQGFASELAVKAMYLTMRTFNDEMPKLMEMLDLTDKDAYDLWPEATRIVHDASYFSVPYELVLPFLQIMQYQATYGIARLTEKEFGFKFTIEPEIEIETGVCDGEGATTWNWDIPALLKNLDDNLKQGVELGVVEDLDDARKKLFAPWMNKKVVKYLDEKYPLLGVSLAKKIWKDTTNEYYSTAHGRAV